MADHPSDTHAADHDLAAAVRAHLAALDPPEGDRGIHAPHVGKIDPAKLKAALAALDAKVQQVLPVVDGLAPGQVKVVADIIAAAIHAVATVGGGTVSVSPPTA